MSMRPLFLRWVLLNSLALVLLVVLGIEFHSKLHGLHLIGIPIVLVVAGYGSLIGGRLSWRTDSLIAAGTDADGNTRSNILHEALYLEHWAWVCAMIGILSSIAGMSLLISDNDPSTLATRVSSGGGAIFYTTFMGVLSMLLLRHEHRMIEHELGV